MSPETVDIVLHGAPMGKQRVRFSRATGRAFTPERTINYESRLALQAQAAMGSRPLFEGVLLVEIVALMPIPESKPKKWKADALAGVIRPNKKPDWDNFAKIIDALNMVVWTDDSQIVDGGVQKFYSDRPMLAIRVKEAPASKIPEWVLGPQPEGVFA